jgi:multiple sugar transport system substrate-binding protein
MGAQHTLSRRDFLRLTAAAASGAVMAACAPATPQVITEKVVETVVVEKEVLVEKEVAKEVVKEVPVEKVVRETVVVEKEVAVAKPIEKAKITFQARGDEAIFNVFRELKRAFAELQPNIDVTIDETPSEWHTKLQLQIAGGTPPDCNFSSYGSVVSDARQGIYEALGPYLDADPRWDPDDFYPVSLENGTYKGELYHLPYDGGSVLLYYNKDLFDEEGLEYPSAEEPLTWDEYLELAMQLTRDMNGNRPEDSDFDPARVTRYGAQPLGSFYWWAYWNGGDAFEGQQDLDPSQWRACALDRPEAYDAIQYVADMGAKHFCAPSPAYEQATPISFFAGNVAMSFQGVWSNVRMRQAEHDWEVAPIIKGVERVPIGWYSGVSIVAPGKSKDASYEWIWFCSSWDGQKIVSKLGQDVPARYALARTDVFLDPTTKPDNDMVYLTELEAPNVRSNPCTFPYYLQMTDLINPMLDPVWRGEKSAEEVCKEIAPKVNHLAETGEIV